MWIMATTIAELLENGAKIPGSSGATCEDDAESKNSISLFGVVKFVFSVLWIGVKFIFSV